MIRHNFEEEDTCWYNIANMKNIVVERGTRLYDLPSSPGSSGGVVKPLPEGVMSTEFDNGAKLTVKRQVDSQTAVPWVRPRAPVRSFGRNPNGVQTSGVIYRK